MKKILCLLLSVFMAAGISAQEMLKERGMPEHVTENVFASQSGQHRVGVPGKPLPKTGTVRVPLVLVQFDDLKFKSASTDDSVHVMYDRECNGEVPGEVYRGGLSDCSVRDYFAIQSDSAFLPEFEVIGPLTLDNGYAYYGSDAGGRDFRIKEFFSEACSKAVTQFSTDWSSLDNDGDGKIDFVFFIYAGEGQNGCDDTNTIWPKEMPYSFDVTTPQGTITFGGCGCCNETYQGVHDGIGTLVHELSHGVGLCDLYDYSRVNFGMDYWDVMASGEYVNGAYSPCGYSTYEMDFLGWRPLEEVELDSARTHTLYPVSLGGRGYRITDPENPNHYFILENRQNVGNDNYLAAPYSFLKGETHGLLVTHVQYKSDIWSVNRINTGTNQLFTLLPADGSLFPIRKCTTKSQIIEETVGDVYPGYYNVTTLELFGQKFEIEEKIDPEFSEDCNVIVLKVNGGTPDPDPATAIDAISADNTAAQYYDSTGRIVRNPRNGIYIRNGRKVIVK